MNAYAHKREMAMLSISFFLHVSMIVFYFLFVHQKSLEILPAKTIVMEIATVERSQAPIPAISKLIEEVTPEALKPIQEKSITRSKPVIKKEAMIPIKEEVTPAPLEPVLSEPIAVEPTPVVSSTQSIPFEPYVKTDFEIIRDKVLSHLVYPSIAKRMNWNGVVHVALVIDSSGYLLSASIHQSSGRDILDNAALEAANKLKNQQLPKPQSTSTVILPIAFKLR